ncbi:MAG: hypothetical protein ACKPKO_11320, partial [Candidatus Fonsibacter sp.]
NMSQISSNKPCITSSSRGYNVIVAVYVVRLVTVAKLHLVELAVGVNVQWDAGNAAGVLPSCSLSTSSELMRADAVARSP